MNKLILTIVCLSSVALFSLCHKKNKEKESCNLNCLNGGTCVDDTCNCPPDWSGPNCDTFFTFKFEGKYTKTNYSCDRGPQNYSNVLNVKVDSTDKNKLWIENILVTMTSHSVFAAEKSDAGMYHRYFGNFSGSTMQFNHFSRAGSININCAGTYTKN